MPAAWVAAAAAVVGALGSSGALGGGEGQTTSTTNNDPWWGQQEPLLDVFSRAKYLYKNNPSQQYYPGQTVADQSPYTQAAIARMASAGLNPDSLTNQAADQFGKTVRGDYLSPDSNPYLKASVDDALGQIKGKVAGLYGSHGGNNYGSSAHEEFLTRNLADTALPIYAQNYQQERARQMNAAQLAPGMEANTYAPLAQAGTATDAFKQAQIDADKARFDFNQNSPWDTLQRYQSAITGNYGGIQSSTNPYFKASPLLNALGGATAGFGLYNQGKQAGAWGQPSNPNASNYDSWGNYTPTYSGYDASGGSAYG